MWLTRAKHKIAILFMLFSLLVMLSLNFSCRMLEQETTPVSPVITPIPETLAPPPPKPASFQISNLTITPTEVLSGFPFTIQAIVANVGEISGNYTVELKVDDAVLETKEVVLAAGASQNITFTKWLSTLSTLSATKTYTVKIGDQSGECVVKLPPIPTPVVTEPTPAPQPTIVPNSAFLKLEGLRSIINVVNISPNYLRKNPPPNSYVIVVYGTVESINGTILSLNYKNSIVKVDFPSDQRFFVAKVTSYVKMKANTITADFNSISVGDFVSAQLIVVLGQSIIPNFVMYYPPGIGPPLVPTITIVPNSAFLTLEGLESIVNVVHITTNDLQKNPPPNSYRIVVYGIVESIDDRTLSLNYKNSIVNIDFPSTQRTFVAEVTTYVKPKVTQATSDFSEIRVGDFISANLIVVLEQSITPSSILFYPPGVGLPYD